MTQFKSTFGITTFVLAIIFLFNSFFAFLLMALVGVLIYPKTSQYIRQKYKLNRTLKNTIIVFLFPIGFILGMYHSIIAFDSMFVENQKEFEAHLQSKGLTICGVCKDLENEQDKKGYQKSKDLSDDVFDKILAKCEECKAEERKALRDSLNNFLSPKNLNVCLVIDDYLKIDDEVLKAMDKKYPKYNSPKGYYDSKLNQAVTKYRNKHQVDKISFENIITFLDDCNQEKAERRRKQTQELKETRENFRNNCLSGYDGRHRALADLVKDNLNNPNSFEHVETRFSFKENYVTISMKYRGQNGFGAIVTDYITAKVSLKDCDKILEIVEQ